MRIACELTRRVREQPVIMAPSVPCNQERDLSIAGMYIQTQTASRERGLSIAGMYIQRQREVYQAPACIYKGRERSINRRHVYTKAERDLSSAGMYIQRQREVYQAPACIYSIGRERDLSIAGMYMQRQREIYQAPACIYKQMMRRMMRRIPGGRSRRTGPAPSRRRTARRAAPCRSGRRPCT